MCFKPFFFFFFFFPPFFGRGGTGVGGGRKKKWRLLPLMFRPVSPKAGPEDQGNDRIRTLLLWLFSKFSQESQIMPVRKKWGDAVHRGPRLRPLRYKQPCTEGTPSLRIRFSCSARPSLLQCCLAPPGAPRVMTSHLFTPLHPPTPR